MENHSPSLFDYQPVHAGWKEPTTSRDAAIKIEQTGRAELLRRRCFEAIKSSNGLTAKEVSSLLEEDINNTRPRISELYQKLHLIDRSGQRRNNQHVWIVK